MPKFISAKRTIIAAHLIAVLFCASLPPATAQAAEKDEKIPSDTQTSSQWGATLRFYQNTISRADGNRCPMHPSCSRYALDAFQKYNFITAWMLTSDRLLRCGHNEIDLAPKVHIRGKIKAYDPLTANTLWWSKP